MAAEALVIGAGPAGLMAAEMLSEAGLSVVIADQMPSPARKFLMAGKSGLNLTKSEPDAAFYSAFDSDWVVPMLRAFGPDAVQDWARGLGQDVFTGSSGRVFPKAMKASPLLRAWLGRLDARGVVLQRRWRWRGFDGGGVQFDTPEGALKAHPTVTILALGGGSWARLGSDGAWLENGALGSETVPFQPSNAGLCVDWSAHIAKFFGTPLKNVTLSVGTHRERGEVTVSARGLEGGGLYPLTRHLRGGAPLHIDLKPDLSEDQLRARLTKPRGKTSLANHLRKTARLDPVAIALLQEWARPLPDDLAPVIKALPVKHQGLRPLDEAISTAGGLTRAALDDALMLHNRPGTFACGEMLDWDAPTGGYLITACLATGRWAGQHAVTWARMSQVSD